MRPVPFPLQQATAAVLIALLLVPVTSRAQSPSDSVYWICLERGDSLEARDVDRASDEFVRYRQADGSVRFVRTSRIRHILDASGSDRYGDVLNRPHQVRPRFDPAPAKPDVPVYHSLRFRGGDNSLCSSFLITELSVLVPVTDDAGRGSEQSTFYCGDLGWIKNVGSRSALGASAFWETGSSVNRGGVRVRCRRWLGHQTSVEVSPGIVVAGDGPFQGPGFVGQAAFNAGDLMSLVVEAEVDRFSWPNSWNQPSRKATDASLRVGVRGGSFVGVAAGVILGLVAGAASIPDWGEGW
jgi:hypothetical protein